ncbi:GNAT family N-acetyltransferase [Staphylococcus arlettae]|uniref:GNAT family N-acetyltransferase n=1 Tax=Staphylococcus arlettae TaxID=29378 RepID=UPI001E5ED3B7|nr:GNAT family N-acetyltransferase [Staphylococcus arlettae]MCD8840968.1 GNAT family N-acetyltransferase [Staphylococcus arlettae]
MQLENYATAHKRQLEQYELTEAQLAYTDYPNNNIQQASDKHHPIVCFNQDRHLVCYFALQEHHEFESYTTHSSTLLLRCFSTDTRFLHQGYATAALQHLPAFITEYYPHITSVVLGVNIDNATAQALYAKCQFKDSGQRVQWRKGTLMIMELVLSK